MSTKKIVYTDLTAEFLKAKIPEIRLKSIDLYEQNLPSCLFADNINSKLCEALLSGNYRENSFVKNAFLMFEELAEFGDEEVRNLLQVSLLENLYDYKKTYSRSVELMGNNTRILFEEISDYLNIPN